MAVVEEARMWPKKRDGRANVASREGASSTLRDRKGLRGSQVGRETGSAWRIEDTWAKSRKGGRQQGGQGGAFLLLSR